MLIQNLLEKEEFKKLLNNHCAETISYFLDGNIEFGILCNLSDVSFEIKLPDDIYSELRPLTLFMVAGYSFESAYISHSDSLIFEAGFGKDNFGTVVEVPLDSILQIVIGETVVFINLTATLQKKKRSEPNKGSRERSRDAIFSNPVNKKLLKGTSKNR